MFKFISAIVLGALVSFGWGYVSWTLLNWHNIGMNEFKDEPAVARVIKENATLNRGIYVLPAHPHVAEFATPEQVQSKNEAYENALKAGPYLYAIVRPGKNDKEMSTRLTHSLIRSVVACLVLAVLLMQLTLPYGGRVCFAAAIGALVGITAEIPRWIWFELPQRELIVNMADAFIEWTLVGVVLALFLGRSPNVREDY